MPEPSFLANRLRSIGYAVKGAWKLLSTERSFQVQSGIALLVCFGGWYYDISRMEWIAQLLAIALVMGLEGLNTAIEALSDFVQPRRDPRIGHLKDISAGAVLIGAVASAIVGGIIYIPRIFS